ncbi:MAG: hypothetical protein F6K28_53990 [Microcoleus sp. SIO2G3]|nr:hypothetical protein [Microcoleus sp. SIO2G3]
MAELLERDRTLGGSVGKASQTRDAAGKRMRSATIGKADMPFRECRGQRPLLGLEVCVGVKPLSFGSAVRKKQES